jgi:hypothetical protein
MPNVVRDNGIRTARDGQFEQEFIARIRQERPEPEVNVCLSADEAELADDGVDVAFGNLQTVSLTIPDRLIFENERH